MRFRGRYMAAGGREGEHSTRKLMERNACRETRRGVFPGARKVVLLEDHCALVACV